MGNRNRRMAYVGQPGPRPMPAYAEHGPQPGQEMDAVLACVKRRLATTVFYVATKVGVVEQDARQHIEALHYEGCCVLDGDDVYTI